MSEPEVSSEPDDPMPSGASMAGGFCAARVVAIIQARMGSTRFPGKVLADLAGRPMLWHILNRVRRAGTVTRVVVATSRVDVDDAIVDFCRVHNVDVYRGSESDVLDRFYHAAQEHGAEAVVRLTADCPLIDPEVIDQVVGAFLAERCDYATNTLRYTYPDGLDVEVFSMTALESAWRNAARAAEREHVTTYIRTSGRFELRNVENPDGCVPASYRWTVDEPRDLAFVRAVYDRLGSARFGYRQVIGLIQEDPSLSTLNSGSICNEGYYKSLAGEAPIPARTRTLTRSHQFKERASRVIPSGTQTLSKGPTQFVQGVAPNFLARAQGCRVWDVDGNEYIDFAMALGPIILGHCYPVVDEAVKRQMADGTVFSLPHWLEVEVAERLVDMVPCAEMVRFGKNGSDATAGAVRLARAYTGREIVACCGYHGWQDWYIGSTTFNKGVPESVRQLTVPFEYNDVESLKRIFAEQPNKVAAVILEPMGVVEPQRGFLESVRELCRKEGALLIFDEVITGFRFAPGGAQEYFGVVPDLACFGKALANGYPLSAVVGPRDIMKTFEATFFSSTFGGEALSLAAAQATMKEIAEKNVTAHLWAQGRQLLDGVHVLAREFGVSQQIGCKGLAPRTVFSFQETPGKESLQLKSLFQQECLKRGVLFTGSQNVCFSHSPAEIDYTLRVYRSALEIVAQAIRDGRVADLLEGTPVQEVFRRA